MIKKLLVIFLFLTVISRAQCPQVFDYLGNLSNKPYWISCTGGSYVLNFQSNSSWGTYTLSWGDGSPNTTGASYTASSIITHSYSPANDTFVVNLIIPSLSCTLTGVVVMEKPVNASIQIPLGGVTTACAPATLAFINSSTDVSKTTKFTWNFGDGSPLALFTYTNGGQTVSHTYSVGTVNCQTQVTLMAENYCSFGSPTTANFNPIQIYDKDIPQITPSALIKCWPDNSFTFTNTTTRNCLAQGNNGQRYEWWSFGKYWGNSQDSIYNWKPWPPTTPITITYTNIGTYTIQLKDSSFCGQVSTVISVNIVNPPNAGVVGPGGPSCQGTSVTFTNTSGFGYFYQWNFGDGGGFSNFPFGPQSHTYNTAGTYTVKLVAFIPGGGGACTDTAQTVVNILPSPTSNFVFTPTVGCNSLSGVTFTDASTAAISWAWNFGNGNTSNVQVPPAQNYTTTGTYTISLVVTGGNSCVNTKTASITVYQKPTAAFSPTAACMLSPTSFTDQSTFAVTNPITNWTWTFGDGAAGSTLQNPSYTYTAQNTYTVKLVVKTAFCSDSITKNVTVNIKPTANYNFNPLIGCPTLSVNFTNASSNANTYAWNFGVTPTATSSAVSPVFNFSNTTAGTANYTVTLVALTTAGCKDSIKKVISVFPKPTASFTSNAVAACTPLSVTFTNTSTGATSYNWNFGDSNTSTATSPTHTYINTTLLLQTFTCQLVATNTDGCKDTMKLVITAYPKPLFSFTMVPASGCAPLTINFPTVLGAVSYNWDFGDGNTSTSANPSHVFTNTTAVNQSYTVTLIAGNGFGCIDTAYGVPVVFPKPVPNFTYTPAIGCSPLPVNFTNSSTGNVGNAWTFGDGAGASTLNASHTFTANNTAANTTYSVKLVVTSSDACKDSLTQNVTLFPKPLAGFTVDTPACSPKILNFTNQSTGAVSYDWNFGNGNVSTATSPTHQYVNNSGSNQTFTVQLIANNSNNCSDTLRIPLVVHSKPNFNIVQSPDSGCSPLRVVFQKITGVVGYNWSFGDGGSAATATVSHVFVNSGTSNAIYTVQLIATDANNCADTSTRNVKVFPLPSALFTADPTTVLIPQNVVKFFNLSVGNVSNYWIFGDGNTSTALSPSHTYTQVGQYQTTLIVTSSKGCRDTFLLPNKIIAQEESEIQVPNAFTPNILGPHEGPYNPNDLSNDVFHPVIKGGLDKYQFSIFSRWGELLFDTKDMTMGWDGYYKGKMCTQDVYIWKIKGITLDGAQVIEKTGDVLLLK